MGFVDDQLIPLVDKGLGNSAHLVDLGDGRALADGDETDLGGLTLRALATPGHTDEHLSFLLLDGTRELGVFTGGSLIVGSAARTDLLGADAVVACGHGERAMTAASLLQRAGHQDLAVLDGGPADWAKATGRALEEDA